MPELPEVETVARDLRNELVGRRFISAWVSQPGVLRYPDAESFCAALPGRAVLSVERRGKYILCEVGEGDATTEIAAPRVPREHRSGCRIDFRDDERRGSDA